MASEKRGVANLTSSLRVAIAQMQFAPTLEDNLETAERLLVQTRRRRADAVLFPECAVTGYGYDFGMLRPAEVRDALKAVGEMAGRFGVNLLVGSAVFSRRKLYNCLVGRRLQDRCRHGGPVQGRHLIFDRQKAEPPLGVFGRARWLLRTHKWLDLSRMK